MLYSYRRFSEKDDASVEELLKITFPSFKEENLWYWKYKLNPCFDASLVVVAEKNNEIIGINYWLMRDIKLLADLQIRAALGADVAVHPEHRGLGVATELMRYPRLSGTFKQNKILLTYMFGRPELSKGLYQPAGGYIVAPDCTITYRRLFTCRQLKEKFHQIDEAIQSNQDLKRKLLELTMCISFKLKGAPDFSLHIESDKVYLTEDPAEKPDVIIEGSLPLSSLVFSGAVGTGDLVKALFTGKFKVKKGLLRIIKVMRVFRLFQTALKMRA